jgi:hypothetical protein
MTLVVPAISNVPNCSKPTPFVSMVLRLAGERVSKKLINPWRLT